MFGKVVTALLKMATAFCEAIESQVRAPEDSLWVWQDSRSFEVLEDSSIVMFACNVTVVTKYLDAEVEVHVALRASDHYTVENAEASASHFKKITLSPSGIASNVSAGKYYLQLSAWSTQPYELLGNTMTAVTIPGRPE